MVYTGPLATSCISFHKGSGDFNFAGTTVSFEDIGLAIADAIMQQQKYVKLGSVEVTPNYLFKMMQYTAREGWFVDELSENGQDHCFDPNEPTPGAHWNKVRKLIEMACEESTLARQFKDMGRRDLAKNHERQSAIKFREADKFANKLT